MAIVTTMCKLFLAMGIGFFLYKRKIFTGDTNARVSALLVKIGVPCIILNSVSSVPHDDPQMVLRIFFAGILSYGIFLGVGYLFTWIFRVPKYLKGTFICMMLFANSAFMGYPVVQALYGDVAIFYVTIFTMPFNILFFTLAPHYFKKDASIQSGSFQKELPKPKELINSGLVAAIAALVIYFCNLQLPQIFFDCVGFIGGITTPMSMVIIGSSLAGMSLGKIFKAKGIWYMLPFRLILIPIVIWLFMHLFTNDPQLIAICTISSGMPVASLVAMGSSEQPRQNQSTSIAVALSTICSLVTIPIMCVLLT